MSEYYILNYILVGDSNVGKSCILTNLTQKKFMPEHSPTIGVEFGSMKIKQNDKKFKIVIWDTAGQERYHAIVKTYYRNALGALLVYDVSNRSSFKSLKRWIDDVRKEGNENISIVLVGNKMDLEKREITFEEGQYFAASQDLDGFIETSALDGTNIEEAFVTVFKEINRKIEEGILKIWPKEGTKLSSGLEIGNQEKNEKCSC